MGKLKTVDQASRGTHRQPTQDGACADRRIETLDPGNWLPVFVPVTVAGTRILVLKVDLAVAPRPLLSGGRALLKRDRPNPDPPHRQLKPSRLPALQLHRLRMAPPPGRWALPVARAADAPPTGSCGHLSAILSGPGRATLLRPHLVSAHGPLPRNGRRQVWVVRKRGRSRRPDRQCSARAGWRHGLRMAIEGQGASSSAKCRVTQRSGASERHLGDGGNAGCGRAIGGTRRLRYRRFGVRETLPRERR